MKKKKRKIALYIDCENIDARYMKKIHKIVSKKGEIVISRAYANWNIDNHLLWRDKLMKYAIEQIQPTSTMKNASDMKICVDVMNTFAKPYIETIIIVSSDSDFTAVAIEGKSRGMEMIGIGKEHAPSILQQAYSEFILLPRKIKKRNVKKTNIPDIHDPINKESNKFLVGHMRLAIKSIQKMNDRPHATFVNLSQIAVFFRDTLSLTAKQMGFRKWKDIAYAYPEHFKVSESGKTCYVKMIKKN